MSDDNLLSFQRLQNAQLHTNLATAASNEALSSIAASQATRRAATAQQQIDELMSEVSFYRRLLSSPLHVIARKNEAFRKNYHDHQQLLASWMVSQKSFKELTIQFGAVLGKTHLEVIELGVSGKMSVRSNENAPEHNTRADNSSIIKPYIEKLKAEIAAKST